MLIDYTTDAGKRGVLNTDHICKMVEQNGYVIVTYKDGRKDRLPFNFDDLLARLRT